MILIHEIERVHDILVERFGGRQGIRDLSILESAAGRPYHTFDGRDLYLMGKDKAAALFESLIANHPFIDGNKRTAYVLLRLMLLEAGLDLRSAECDTYDFVIKSASGGVSFDEMREWLSCWIVTDLDRHQDY